MMRGKFMVTRGGGCGAKRSKSENTNNTSSSNQNKQHHHISMVDFILSALRKSMVSTCRQDHQVISPVHHMEIGWPTNVQHVTHVTFDRFHGCFLGLPLDFQLDNKPPTPVTPSPTPTASVSVSGVSANSMQWSYDTRCNNNNSVPTILLLMQERLYALGGLKAEGIFRINPENSQEEYVRNQLNRGIVPENIDVHRLAGSIKAWFRELPYGVLDGLSPEQVLQCNTEEDFVELIKQLKPTESCLLGWAIDLMADVVEQEESNKMNARNIAMVFAPNMSQMSNPLTALMHAVQVMNLLKTLILRKLRERKETATGKKNEKHYDDQNEKYYGPVSDDEEQEASYDQSSEEERDEIESLSEIEECFLRQLDGKENAKDGFRKQLERILCSPRNGSNMNNADSCVSFSDSRIGSSCISTSDDDESRLSSIAFRARDGCKKRTRHNSNDQYLLTNKIFSQHSPV